MSNIEQSVKNYLSDERIGYKSSNFGNVKPKLDKFKWTSHQIPPEEESHTRVVKMENNSSMQGDGQFRIQKEGKPVSTLQLTQGIMKGYPHRVVFKGPFGDFMARIDSVKSEIVDHAGILLETTVPLSSGVTAHARIQDKTKMYQGSFTCEANVSGKVMVIHSDDETGEIKVSELKSRGLVNPFVIEGTLYIHFQDNHSVNIS